MIRIKRVYEELSKKDGLRILIDRLWPRGLSKREAKVDLWLREIAPSDRLRKWFSHDPKKWKEFQERYKKELSGKRALVDKIKKLEKNKGIITLLYSAKDEKHNNALFLKNILNKI